MRKSLPSILSKRSDWRIYSPKCVRFESLIKKCGWQRSGQKAITFFSGAPQSASFTLKALCFQTIVALQANINDFTQKALNDLVCFTMPDSALQV